MEQFLKVIVLALFAVSIYGQKQKDSDEGRPYEFGFTIDGQQHRHEKKDERGIIQGEFGFITADGIYHVTVYATDENGDFKILSMRNLRISAPLDGSPFKGEISPEANKYRKQANLAPLPELQNDAPAPPPPQQKPQEIVVTTPKGIVKFTTQPTIKPACAGCGYVTTQQPKPLVPYGSSQPDTNPGTPNTQSLNPTKVDLFQNEDILQSDQPIEGTGPQYPQKPNLPGGGSSYQTASAPQSTNYNGFGGQAAQPGINSNQINPGIHKMQSTFGQGIQNSQYNQNTQPDGQGIQANTPYTQNDGQVVQNIEQNPQITQNTQPNTPYTIRDNNEYTGDAGIPNTIGGGQNTQPGVFSGSIYSDIPEGNPLQLPGARPQTSLSSLPPIKVSDGVIHVEGDKKQDIPIKDKFPGMQDGLPEGIDEKDITNLLYKFHYTVGFHGHYEKGLKNGAKIGGYFVNGRDGISRVVTYIADENGYRPKVRFINIGLDSDDTPKAETEKTFGLKDFEFVWYPL